MDLRAAAWIGDRLRPGLPRLGSLDLFLIKALHIFGRELDADGRRFPHRLAVGCPEQGRLRRDFLHHFAVACPNYAESNDVSPDDPGESADEILATAKGTGLDLTEWQLRRWHRAHILPAPKQEHDLGIPGSRTIYPSGTTSQLLALCQIQQSYQHSLQRCGEALWWRGFHVGVQYSREILENRAIWYDDYLPKIHRTFDSDFAPDAIEHLRTFRTDNKVFRKVRKRVGQKYFATFFEFIRRLLTGEFEGWSSYVTDGSDAEKLALDKALKLSRARSEAAISQNQRLYEEFEGAFQLISARLGGLKLVEIYKTLSDQQIVRARNELRLFLTIAKMGKQPPNNPAGLKMLAEIEEQIDFRTAQLMLLFLTALNEDRFFQERAAQIVDEFRKGAQRGVTPESIRYLRACDPALAEIVFPN